MDSIMGVQNILKLFYTYSELKFNCDKSEILCSDMRRELVEEIQNTIGFKSGALLVRYLGVLLVTCRLTFKDCSPLIDKISARSNVWSTKLLSYAGRLLLIQSVLYNIQNFWCRHFILPKGVLKKINQLCSGFFWKGKNQSTRGTRLSWEAICYPKSDGGLRLKDLKSWNHACVLQNIWAIIVNSGSLWIAGIYEYVLKERSI